ncbi:hypothetical protein EYV94_22815 [Puteibacter caeruleilacunae]|nr:hypothetical protein EYV94_22815 [Puteibacter caeruleilacunae]
MEQLLLVKDELKIHSLVEGFNEKGDFDYLSVIYNHDVYHNGFSDTENGILFLKKFIQDGIILARRDLSYNKVDTKFIEELNPHGINGVFFYEKNSKLESKFKELDLYHKYTKKMLFLKDMVSQLNLYKNLYYLVYSIVINNST